MSSDVHVEQRPRWLGWIADELERGVFEASRQLLLYADGGGNVRGAILRPVVGRERIARFFAGLLAKTPLPLDHFVLTIETDDQQCP